jgi:hypothetical protein
MTILQSTIDMANTVSVWQLLVTVVTAIIAGMSTAIVAISRRYDKLNQVYSDKLEHLVEKVTIALERSDASNQKVIKEIELANRLHTQYLENIVNKLQNH